MSFVEARDHALWVDHIHGNPALQARILALREGEPIDLEVEGVRSLWHKIIVPGRDGPRHALKASGEAQRHWHSLRNYRHGQLATIKDCS